jgi:hypothetical protein
MSSVALEDLGKQFRGNLVEGSSSRFDSRMTTFGDADYLFNEATLYPCMSVIPTSTGFGFVKDRRRRRNADNSDWIEEDLTKHFHDDETDDAGGSFSEIERRNFGNTSRWLNNTFNVNDYVAEVSGTGAAVANEISGDIGRIRIEAGTTLNGYANAQVFGVPQSFAQNSAFMAMVEHEGNLTSYIMKLGLNAENINVANDTTAPKYGVEACSASGSNVLLFSCKPPTRSTLITGYTHDVNLHSWYVQHILADNKIYLTRDVDFPNTVFKDSDIPISGKTVLAKYWQMGMKSTVASASKILRWYGGAAGGTYGEDLWQFYYNDVEL